MSPLNRRRITAAVVLGAALVAPSGAAFAATPGVDPSLVTATLTPGGSTTVTKTVTTPQILPKPDIYFLADNTGSMSGAIANVRTNAGSILSSVNAAATDAQFGVARYRDFPGPASDAFAIGQSLTASTAAVTTAINAWDADLGGDGPEANLYALHELATTGGFRAGSSRIVVWFGDAPGHDPVCSAISGEPGDVTEASVTAELQAAGITVIAVSVTTGLPDGLDGDPVSGSGDYGVCGTPGGSTGQATRIAAATGGTFFGDVPPDQVANKIKEGLGALPAEVTASVSCDPGLSVSFTPALPRTVTSGDSVVLSEKITAGGAAHGLLTCTTKFLVNGAEVGDSFTQRLRITVNRPPDCSAATVTPGSLWPPDHSLRTVTVTVPDPDGDPVTATVTKVTQDEALNGLGDGDTAPDAAAVSGHGNQVRLRAERSGKGDGRVYRLAVSATDGTGSCDTGLVKVTVPHDQAHPAVDTTSVSVNSYGS